MMLTVFTYGSLILSLAAVAFWLYKQGKKDVELDQARLEIKAGQKEITDIRHAKDIADSLTAGDVIRLCDKLNKRP